MSENIKLRFERPTADLQGSADPLHATSAEGDDASQVDNAESQMRKALGLLGDTPKHRPESERAEPSGRGSDRFAGGLHRRRFVQDGDVPVTVLRREPGQDVPAHRSAATVAAPSNSRLQRVEAALAVETGSREKAERLLAEAQAAVRDLQTKIGHAELAKDEAVDALRHEREELSAVRAEVEALTLRLNDNQARVNAAEQALHEHKALLEDARHASKLQEKTLRATEQAKDAAEELVRTLSHSAPEPLFRNMLPRRRAVPERAVSERAASEHVVPEPEDASGRTKRGRSAAVIAHDVEPEPVKWWLAPVKPTVKRK